MARIVSEALPILPGCEFVWSHCCSYFTEVDKATVFSPLLSGNYYESDACFDESSWVHTGNTESANAVLYT